MTDSKCSPPSEDGGKADFPDAGGATANDDDASDETEDDAGDDGEDDAGDDDAGDDDAGLDDAGDGAEGGVRDAGHDAHDAGPKKPVRDPLTVGWTSYNPLRLIQIETHDEVDDFPYVTSKAGPGSSYQRANGIETFKLFNHNVWNRVKSQSHDDTPPA